MSNYEQKLGGVRVGLRKDLVVSRQDMRGQPKYVLHDPLSFQNHVLSWLEYRVVAGIAPTRRLSQNFTDLVERGVMDEARRDEFYDFVLKLHSKNLLQLPIVQADTLFKRYTEKREARRKLWHRSLLYFTIPLLNPDRFLNQTVRHVSWLFSRTGLLLWAGLMLCVLWTCLGRFGEMFAETAGLLDLSNLPIMWAALIGLKVVHEFGHAYACKRFGGEVPQMGLAFIVLTPCAYVDAGSSWTFPSRWHRITVAMAGMYVESIVAGVFALIWASTQAGLLHALALDVMILASVITVFMNLNPLLRFDGYYVLSDLLGVINLRQRSDQYLASFARWVGLGLPKVKNSFSTWERWVFGTYAPCSFLYKIVLAISITAMVVVGWPAGGAFLGAIFGWLLIVQPLKRLLAYLLRSEETVSVRSRARWVAAGVFFGVPALCWFVPISSNIVVPGVLEPMERFSVRAPVSGFVTEVPATHGSIVAEDELLCVLRNPELEKRHIEVGGDMSVERVRLDAEEAVNPTLAATHRARLTYLTRRAAEMERRLESMDIRAGRAGTLVRSDREGWLGRYVRLGQELFQVHSDRRLLRVVLTDHDVLRAHLVVGSVAEVRWTSDPTRTVRAVVREVRRSSSRTEIPMEVTMLAGGEIYAQRTEGDNAVAAQPFLHVFLEVDSIPLGVDGLTARVRIRARLETLGHWIRQKALGFYNAWRMS